MQNGKPREEIEMRSRNDLKASLRAPLLLGINFEDEEATPAPLPTKFKSRHGDETASDREMDNKASHGEHTLISEGNGDFIWTPEIEESGSMDKEVERYFLINAHMKRQVYRFRDFLYEDHKADAKNPNIYKELAELIGGKDPKNTDAWDKIVRDLTNLYAKKGLFHQSPKAKERAIKWFTWGGTFSQYEEILFGLVNLIMAAKGADKNIGGLGSWGWGVVFLIPAFLQIIPNFSAVQPEEESKNIVDPDYTKFEIPLPKNELDVEYQIYILKLLNTIKQEKANPSKAFEAILAVKDGLLGGGIAMLLAQLYNFEDDNVKYYLAITAGITLIMMNYIKGLRATANYTNAALTFVSFIVSSLLGGAYQGNPIVLFLKWLLPDKPDQDVLLGINTSVYAFFAFFGLIYYTLQVIRDAIKSGKTYISEKNPAVGVYRISKLAFLDLAFKGLLNYGRRGISFGGIWNETLGTYNITNYPYKMAQQSAATFAGTHITALTRQTTFTNFLDNFASPLIADDKFICDPRVLNWDNTLDKTFLTEKEVYKILIPSLGYGSAIGLSSGIIFWLFKKNTAGAVLIGLGSTISFGGLSFYTQRLSKIYSKACAKITIDRGITDSASYEPGVKLANIIANLADTIMRLFAITGMSESLSFFEGFTRQGAIMKFLLYVALVGLGVAPVIDEWNFLSKKSIKGIQGSVDRARLDLGCHIYRMANLPPRSEYANYKNMFIITNGTDEEKGGVKQVSIFFMKEQENKEIAPKEILIIESRKAPFSNLLDQVPDGKSSEPIYSRLSFYNKPIAASIHQQIQKMKEDDERKKPLDAGKAVSDEVEKPTCGSKIGMRMSQLTVKIFGPTKVAPHPAAAARSTMCNIL